MGTTWEYMGVHDSAWVLDNGTVEGSECVGFRLFVYSAPILGSGWENMVEHGRTWENIGMHGIHRISTLCVFSANNGECMGVHGSTWKYMGVHESTWDFYPLFIQRQ